MARVYISSSYRDLTEYRRRVAEKLVQLGHVPVGMEADGASEHPPLDVCLGDVRSCHGYLGLLGFRYGSCPPGMTLSYTELEYDEAGKRKAPMRLLFLATPDAAEYAPRFVDVDRSSIDAFRERVSSAHSVAEFSSPAELGREVERAVRQQIGTGRSIPDLLPYLCDRQDQLDALKTALSERKEQRPVLLVVYGDQREEHHRFVQRLVTVSLPEHLDLKPTDKVSVLRLKWPETRSTRRQRLQWFATQLAETALRARSIPAGGIEEIISRMAAARMPVLVSATLQVDRWSADTAEAIGDFASFWESCPDFPSDQPLVVCLSIVYPPPRPARWLSWARLTGTVQDHIETLDIRKLSRVTVAMPPRLGHESVSRQHVDNWLNAEVVKLADDFALDEDALRREIDTFFEQFESGTRTVFVPMRDLALHLTKALQVSASRAIHGKSLFS